MVESISDQQNKGGQAEGKALNFIVFDQKEGKNHT